MLGLVLLVLFLLPGCSAVTARSRVNDNDADTADDSLFEISYVIEPFEAENIINDESSSSWFLETTTTTSNSSDDDDDDDLWWNFQVDTYQDDALYGNSSLRIIASTSTGTSSSSASKNGNGNSNSNTSFGTLTFGWRTGGQGEEGAGEGPPHNCYGARYLSLWYKIIPTSTNASSSSSSSSSPPLLEVTNIKLSLSNNTNSSNSPFFSYHANITIPEVEEDSAAAWQELQIPIDRTTTSDLNLLRQIKSWQIEVAVLSADNQDDDPGNVTTSTILLDQLACVGGGEMFGNAFRLGGGPEGGSGNSWEDAIQQGIWNEEYYQSNISKSLSNVQFIPQQPHQEAAAGAGAGAGELVVEANNKLFLNYTIEQTEAWGGFVSFHYLAPANAYYNLSKATDITFGHLIHQASSQPGRAHFRLILTDSSEGDSDTVDDYERWYSFHYILDGNDGATSTPMMVLPLEGSANDQPDGFSFWLSGWSGGIGNRQFDKQHIKGFTIELSMDSQGDIGSLVQGALDIYALEAISRVSQQQEANSEEQTTTLDDDDNAAEIFEIFYVMEPFEWMDGDEEEEHNWFVLGDDTDNGGNSSSSLNLTLTSTDALFGNFSLRVEYQFDVEEEKEEEEALPSSSLSFGAIQSTSVPHNCWGASQMSLWYRLTNTTANSLMMTTQLRLGLWDDDGDLNNNNMTEMEFYTIDFPNIVDDEDWHELRVPMDEFELDNNNNHVAAGGGNGILDLNRLRGWSIDIIMTGGSEEAAASGGTLLVDQLACVGGEELIGAPFFSGFASFEEAVEEEVWSSEFYLSELSQNQSQLVLDTTTGGTLEVDYTVQQVEAWGGFLSAGFQAPGPAYYNLTNANFLNLAYNIRQPASVPGRLHLRLILSDSSDLCSNCTDSERWYNFNYILDDNQTMGGVIQAPLEGSTDPASPFWLPGWSGGLGNSEFNKDQIKGVLIEFSLDSQGDLGSMVSGAIDLFDMTATPRKESPAAAESTHKEDDDSVGVREVDLSFTLSGPNIRRREFLGSQCVETCLSDPECLYALSAGLHCYTASVLEPSDVFIANTVVLRRDYSAYWIDGSRRGDYRSLCDCRESDRTIDCRNRGLRTLPKTLTMPWNPRVLDLRNNSELVLLGSGALDEMSGSLEQLWLPKAMIYVSPEINKLPTLSEVRWEEGAELPSNSITESTEAFSDVCCSRGKQASLSYPGSGLTFCNMEVKRPGSDSTFLPFVNFYDAPSIATIRPSSEFMSEAAESPEKCAEYCSVSSECRFFSYDARLQQAEHVCYLQSSNGTQHVTVCCEDDHYADEAKSLPGWTSGLPPRTRNEIDNARVLITPHNLVADASNGYQTEYDLHLGSAPLRGAVWIEPSISSITALKVSFEPPRVVLYDANATITIKVFVSVDGVDPGTNVPTLIVHNQITSCDVAFMEQTSNLVTANSDTTVFIDVTVPEEEDSDSNVVVIVVVVLCFGIVIIASVAVIAYLYSKRMASEAMWKVNREELIFDDPPVIVGRGSYGLVLKAEFRGTAVAVKRVIPPKRKHQGSGTLSSSGHKFDVERTGNHSDEENDSMPMRSTPSGAGTNSISMNLRSRSQSTDGSAWTLTPRLSDRAAWKKRKEEFMKEMSHLAKLRHPCITTAMGAVIGGKSEPMLVMELMHHGSLYDLLHNETMILDAEIILPILRDISQGMRFLHASNPIVIHGDLKSQNILVDRNFRAKVADFGLSQRKDGIATGTPYWMAPELLRYESGNTTASDIYSFGIIIWEIFSRKEPYYGENMNTVLRAVADKNVNKRPEIPRDMPPAVQSFMTDCLVANPEQRPTFTELDKRLNRIDESMLETGNGLPSSRKGKASNISLFDIFPRRVAEALKQGRKPEPEHRDVVTIFFSDIVGFTDISSKLEPRKIADMLDRLYSVFDDLSHQHDIYKVETIGDAYMAVSNLIKDQPNDHVKRITEFAVEAIEAAKTVAIDPDKPELGCVEIRVGFHSGPVVADVVGTRNPRFCLFGDAVNTASRMESNGKKGRIHCSLASAELLEKQFPEMPLASRGEIDVKGKGKMTTYWVNEMGQRPSEIALDPLLERSVHSLTYYSKSLSFRFTSAEMVIKEDEREDNSSNNRSFNCSFASLSALAETGQQSQRTRGGGSSSATAVELEGTNNILEVGVEQAAPITSVEV